MRDEMSDIEMAKDPKQRGVSYLIPESVVDHVPTLYATHIWNNIMVARINLRTQKEFKWKTNHIQRALKE